LDEISRCRPDLQNKLFPIVHERRVQGILLERLLYRWAAMNPPARDDEPEADAYRGSEPLDPALADRFAFVAEVPTWEGLGERQQEQVILRSGEDVSPAAAAQLLAAIESGRSLLPEVDRALRPQLATYVRLVTAVLRHAGIECSPRRAATLLRNVVVVHAARLVREPAADAGDSACVALGSSLPHRPAGARHALAAALFESGGAARLVAAVAEQCAQLYALVAMPQDVRETVASGSTRLAVWQRVVATLARHDPAAPETPLVSNLLSGL